MKIDIPVKITERALEEVKGIMATKGIPEDYGLRIGIKGAGCSGMGFLLGFDKARSSDMEYELDEVKVYIDKKHTMYLIGLEVDYYEGRDEQGFTFINPEAPVDSPAQG